MLKTLVLSVVLLLIASAGAQAATLAVNSTDIVIADDGLCTLPEAILSANTDSPSGSLAGECPAGSGPDLIELQEGANYVLTEVLSSDVFGDNGLPFVTDNGLVIDGRDAVLRRDNAAPDFRMLRITGTSVTISRLHFENGTSDGTGGAISATRVLTVEHSTFTGNTSAVFGGGVYGNTTSSLMIRDSVFLGNQAQSFGAGVWGTGTLRVERCHFEGNLIVSSGGSGAGVAGSGMAEILDSTFTGNFGGAIRHGDGTLIVRRSSIWGNMVTNAVLSDTNNQAFLYNTTITGNTGLFAGLRVINEATLRNVSIVGNEATLPSASGGMQANDPATVSSSNSIIANNIGGDCNGALTSFGHNLDSDGSCELSAEGDATGDPLLSSLFLADFGVVLLPDPASPAVDTGSPATVGSDDMACELVDQVGRARPVDGDDDQMARCDKGALELARHIFSDGFESGDTTAWSNTID
ncbi:MAG: right-handed parallel beta-helix repeat-containing protein [Acidobacteriota bacterium]